MSIAGGFENAVDAAVEAGCDCLQIFVRNQRQWRAPPLADSAAKAFQRACRHAGIAPVVAHASYLPNPASPAAQIRNRSIAALIDEMERCEALGIGQLVIHPGAHMGTGIEAGIARACASLDRILRATDGLRPAILLETTAGQGTSLGHQVEHLGRICTGVGEVGRLGVCVDTCHVFAAGYDLRSQHEYQRLVNDLDRCVGLSRVHCFHLNDSRTECGSRVDRHEHIGRGRMGRRPFAFLMNDARFRGTPKILETPKGEDSRGRNWDTVNLRLLRRLCPPPIGRSPSNSVDRARREINPAARNPASKS